MPPGISALLLAAGSSSRMGRPKALLPLRGQPAIRRCLEALLGTVEDIIVVWGAGPEAVAEILQDLPVKLVLNPRPGSDMAASVRLGVAALDPQTAGALICLADHPLVQAGTIESLTAAARESPHRIIIPTCRGRRGHPTFFPRELLQEMNQGYNLRELIGRHPEQVTLLPVEDEGVIMDMDTPEEYREICRRLEGETYGR